MECAQAVARYSKGAQASTRYSRERSGHLVVLEPLAHERHELRRPVLEQCGDHALDQRLPFTYWRRNTTHTEPIAASGPRPRRALQSTPRVLSRVPLEHSHGYPSSTLTGGPRGRVPRSRARDSGAPRVGPRIGCSVVLVLPTTSAQAMAGGRTLTDRSRCAPPSRAASDLHGARRAVPCRAGTRGWTGAERLA